MHQKTRYSVRLAERRGVVVRRAKPTDSDVDAFFALLSETSARNQFGIHAKAYYRDFLRLFADRSLLLFADVDGRPAATLVAACFGSEAIYMYGASSTEHRAHGAAFVLQFQAMRWGRDLGAQTYDLWGIPPGDPRPSARVDGRVPGSRGDDWTGLHKFKIGFGGSIETYPPTLERRYRPVMAYLVKHLRRGAGNAT
jgi:lipid II:glycine glycyltransferase (peptidoglycan interpeptide bridge formation enzyme)